MHFTVGIAVRTEEQMKEIYNLIVSKYPDPKGEEFARRSYAAYRIINLPFVQVTIFLIGCHKGRRYNIIYAPPREQLAEEEIFEILMPMIIQPFHKEYLRDINEIYKEYGE